jgi:hypothetical protein
MESSLEPIQIKIGELEKMILFNGDKEIRHSFLTLIEHRNFRCIILTIKYLCRKMAFYGIKYDFLII